MELECSLQCIQLLSGHGQGLLMEERAYSHTASVLDGLEVVIFKGVPARRELGLCRIIPLALPPAASALLGSQ